MKSISRPPLPLSIRLLGLLGLLAVVAAFLVPLHGCAAQPPQLVKPKDFGQTELLTVAIATEAVTQANILMDGRVISPEDGRSLVRQTDQVIADVQLARKLRVTQPTTALQRINLALTTIQGVRNYLVSKGATFTPAATG